MQLIDILPGLAAEIEQLLRSEGEEGLAGQVSNLEIVERCRCGDDFCASFCTQPKPLAHYGRGHRSLELEASKGMMILDVVDGLIAQVEILNCDEIRQKLSAALP